MVMDIDEKLKNIIVAVDFSEESEKAVEFAAGLIDRKLDTTIHLINVVRPFFTPIGDTTGTTEILRDEEEELVKSSRNKLERMVTSLKSRGLKNVQGSVRVGDPKSVIIAAIEEHKAGLIVMGTRKHGFKRGIFMGSVSERVSANSPVSVLIVR